MSDELHSNEEQLEKQLDSNRRNKVKSFNLNISDDFSDDADDEMIFPDDTEPNDASDSIPSRKSDNIILPDDPDDDDYYKSEKEEEKRRKQALKAERKRKKKKAKKNGCVFKVLWLVMVVILGVFLAEFLLVGINDLLGRSRGEEATAIVQIPENADLDTVTDILLENGVISNGSYFKLYTKFTKSEDIEFAQGSFEMENDMDYEAIINYLQTNSNRVDTVTLQFTEGMTVLEIADILSENGVCDKDEFLELCNSDQFDEDFTFLTNGRSNLSGVYYKLEGYLFPDTYEFYQGESAVTTIYRFLNNYETRLYYTKQRIEITDDESQSEAVDTDTDDKNTKKYEKLTVEEQAAKQGMTMDEVMILASMIQAEAADTEDMYIISSVLHNRLSTLETDGYTAYGENINGTLGSDPTIYYPYKQNTAPDNFESSYNTYKIEGLPAGPTCNPGMDAIQAALYPADTNYYFFCHKSATEDSEAEAYYAATIADHNYNMTLAGLN